MLTKMLIKNKHKDTMDNIMEMLTMCSIKPIIINSTRNYLNRLISKTNFKM